MITKNSRRKFNFRDCNEPIGHIQKSGFHSSQKAINEIFKKKYWFEKRDDEKNGKTIHRRSRIATRITTPDSQE